MDCAAWTGGACAKTGTGIGMCSFSNEGFEVAIDTSDGALLNREPVNIPASRAPVVPY